MNERFKMISKLIKRRDTRESYIRSKLSVLLPSQIRSLRLRRGMKQAELGAEAIMKQGRISVLERIGEASFSIETLIKLASAFRVGLIVKFVPMSEMLAWENSFMPDEFDVAPIEKDQAFINYESVQAKSPAYQLSRTETVSIKASFSWGPEGTESHLISPLSFLKSQQSSPLPFNISELAERYPSTEMVGL